MGMTDPFARTELKKPYWHTTMPTLPDRRARQLPERADVVVVGGGYTGLSCARSLARSGARVTLLEAETIGWGASSRNGGIAHPGYKWGPTELRKRYGDEVGTELWTDTVEGWSYLKELVASEGIDAGLRDTGHVELAYAPAHVHELEAAAASLDAMGTSTRLVPRERIHDEIGSDNYHGALVIEGSGSVHPGKLLAGLAEAAARAGVDLHEGVRAWMTSDAPGGGLRVHTNRGAIATDQVVVATNGYTDSLVPALRRRIIPIGSYIVTTERLPDDVVTELSPNGRCFFDTKYFLYYWQVRDGRLMFGGRATFRPTSFERIVRMVHAGMVEVYPQLADRPIEYAWGGKVAFTWDRMPHVGRLGNGVAYSMGYCGTGVLAGPYLGHRLAQWLGGGEPPAVAKLSFPLVPVPYEGRAWFLPIGGEWYKLKDRLAARSRRSAPAAVATGDPGTAASA